MITRWPALVSWFDNGLSDFFVFSWLKKAAGICECA